MGRTSSSSGDGVSTNIIIYIYRDTLVTLLLRYTDLILHDHKVMVSIKHTKNSVYRYPICHEVIEMLVDDTNVQMVLRELQVRAEAAWIWRILTGHTEFSCESMHVVANRTDSPKQNSEHIWSHFGHPQFLPWFALSQNFCRKGALCCSYYIYICIHVNMFVPSSVSSPVLPYSGVSASHRQVYVSWHSQPDFVALAVRSIAQVALKMTLVLRCPAGINGSTTGVGKWGKASYKIREQICIYNIIEPFREQIGFKQTPSNFVQQDIQNFNCQEEDVEPTRLLLPTKIDDGDKISTGANQG